jgi:hypothetical protein
VIPVLAICIALTILFGATGTQLRAGGYALVVGAALFVVAARVNAATPQLPTPK